MGDQRVIWTQLYHHEAHEAHEAHEGKNLLFKINKMPGNITRKRNLGNAFVRNPTNAQVAHEVNKGTLTSFRVRA